MTSILTLRRHGDVFTRAGSRKEREIDNASTTPSRDPRFLQRFEDLPVWYQDNPSIHSGYRPVSNSSHHCFRSWTFLHNETLNIYTHLLPALITLLAQLALQSHLTHYFPHATPQDRAIFSLNLLACTIALLLSTLYHTLMNHSLAISSLWLRIDYLGILLLILGSFFSGIYVGFYDSPARRWTYWTMILFLSLLTALLVIHPKLQGLAYRSVRTAAFVATGLSGFAPVGHGLWLYGWDEMWVRSGMPFWFLEGIIYGIGAAFFATRWPESKWPGKFDFFCSSHQIFHVLVVAGSVVHFMGVWDAYRWHYERFVHL
ncbi:adiponectin receptor protein 1 [Hyaloscypha variabilis]